MVNVDGILKAITGANRAEQIQRMVMIGAVIFMTLLLLARG